MFIRRSTSLSPIFLWSILAVPAMMMVVSWTRGNADAADLLHPTGEFSARLMIVAMMVGPLVAIFGPRRWTQWMMRHRRAFGVAAFGYALLHLVFYVIDMETLDFMLAEIGAPGIWTGWIAFFLMLVPAAISNEWSVRSLRRNWKHIQRLVYLVAFLTVVHWAFLSYSIIPAAIHFAPLLLLNLFRIAKITKKRTML